MKDNIPEEGDQIRFNPKYIDWFRRQGRIFRNGILPTYAEEVFTVERLEPRSGDEYRVHLCGTSTDFADWVSITANGYANASCSGLPCFILANGVQPQSNSLYCSCDGPAVINTALFKTFKVCTQCKKEKRDA